MSIGVEFIPQNLELTTPIVKLTKSRNGKTGTATFLFYNPTTFKFLDYSSYPLQPFEGMYLIWNNKKDLVTKDISIIYNDGQPFLIRSVCIFKTSKHWFNFLKFMDAYSKERGLSFGEENIFS
jgi:photosystem II protein